MKMYLANMGSSCGYTVMAGLVPAIHVPGSSGKQEYVDARDKPGHDEVERCAP